MDIYPVDFIRVRLMSRLHLLPVPDAQVIQFPITAKNSPEAVIAQLANLQANMQALHGSYLGRAYFAQAALWLIARTACEAGDVPNTRAALLDEFDEGTRIYGAPQGFVSA